jgi:hypothetical protein
MRKKGSCLGGEHNILARTTSKKKTVLEKSFGFMNFKDKAREGL